MKKKIVSAFIFIIIFLGFLNYTALIGIFYNYVGNFYSYKEMFFLSIIYHKKAEKILKSDQIIYNLGNDYYNIGSYEQSLEQYKKILANVSLEFKVLHNIGNIFYKMGEKYDKQNINLWKKSIFYYKEALSIEENINTRKNYEYVKEKIINLIKKNDEGNKKELDDFKKKKNNNTENNKVLEDSKENNHDGNKLNNGIIQQKGNIYSNRLNKYKIAENFKLLDITNKEKQTLDDYEKYLKMVEFNNQDIFNKKNINTFNNGSYKNNFYGDPFYDTIFDIGGEKDW